jgi:hypothetical protein
VSGGEAVLAAGRRCRDDRDSQGRISPAGPLGREGQEGLEERFIARLELTAPMERDGPAHAVTGLRSVRPGA